MGCKFKGSLPKPRASSCLECACVRCERGEESCESHFLTNVFIDHSSAHVVHSPPWLRGLVPLLSTRVSQTGPAPDCTHMVLEHDFPGLCTPHPCSVLLITAHVHPMNGLMPLLRPFPPVAQAPGCQALQLACPVSLPPTELSEPLRELDVKPRGCQIEWQTWVRGQETEPLLWSVTPVRLIESHAWGFRKAFSHARGSWAVCSR